ncbi:hypothetical protein L3X38_043398 [Prunus dulcis]|uniref:Integrase catalytic domain-containing protein n=1 Tax=Prunus dulcis TaxID=3755 RepID=A0AAD4UYQ3_PRUDU|nr:hypothetical protein L3X38_043398 [Prunus dulcis]
MMESYLQEFGEMKAKHSSEETLQKWRNLCSVVKNPKRRFCFTANITKRIEAAAMRRTNQICNKRDHTAVNCFFRHANSQSSVSTVPECQTCGKRGHAALDCYHRSNYSFQGQAPPSSLTAMTAQTSYSPEQVWIADSGATHHMVGDVSHLQNMTPCVTEENVTVGNGEGLNILHIGTSNLSCATSRLTMPSVFHVPQLKANLLSVHQLCKDNKCYIVFDVSGFLIQDKVTHQVLLKGNSDHGLYPIPLLPQSTISLISSLHKAYIGQQIKSSLWHHRLGHTTNEVTKKMLQASAISASDDLSLAICSACLQGKMHRLSFPTSHSRATMPSQYVFGVFKKFYAMLTNQYDAKVKIFQTDGGGEFTSTLFTAFLDSKGVNHHLSCPHTPQQNGLAERKNRHVIDTAITLLSAASLPTKFWVHSVAHAVYLINRMLGAVLNHQSPFLKLFGHAPHVQHLRVFGTAVYPYLRCYNVHKLQPRTAQCVFMGYAQGYKGVLCFNMLNGKFVVLRHVLHDETVFPFANKMSSSVSGSFHGNSRTTPVLVSIPIPVSSSTPQHSMSLSPSGLQPAVSHDVIFSHQVSNSDPISRASSSNDSIGNMVPLVSMPAPVLRDDQLQVFLPASSQYDDVSVPSGSVNTHTMTTRSKVGIVCRKPFSDYQCYYTSIPSLPDETEPATYKLASQSPVWITAMQEELDALHMQGTWILVPKPCHKNVVGSKWVYRIKRNSDGTVSRHKACLAAQGFSQEPGLDFSETFSPVVRHTTVRLILSIAAMNKWSLRQLDVKNAFLHDLEEKVFMRQPPGFEDSAHPEFVCQLKKSLYGLKQAPRAWNAKFTGYLPAIGFKSSHFDPSLFVKHTGSDIVILLLYVDDIILTGSKASCIQEVVDELSAVFEMKDMGKLTYFLGLQIDYNAEILRYIQGTLDHGLKFSSGPLQLHAFSDADWAGDVNTRRSTTGFVVFLGPNPISWQSKKQTSVAMSSTEAEYRSLAHTSADIAWIRQVLQDLKVSLPQQPVLHCDNLSAIALSSNPVYHSQIKHLDIDFHFVRERERVQRGDLIVQYTEEQVPDVFTKGLHSPIFLKHCINLRLGNPAGFEGE